MTVARHACPGRKRWCPGTWIIRHGNAIPYLACTRAIDLWILISFSVAGGLLDLAALILVLELLHAKERLHRELADVLEGPDERTTE